jgi:hypothetical protein
MRGSFRLEKGVMSIRYLSFRVPGAEVRLEGTYGLVNRRIDFRGELRMEAKVSEMASGWKSFLLKIVDPLFQTKGFRFGHPHQDPGHGRCPVLSRRGGTGRLA